MHTEYIKLKHGYPHTIEATSRITEYAGFEYRLVYHSEYGFGLQARQLFEDWVDVDELLDEREVVNVFKNLLGFGIEQEHTSITLTPLDITKAAYVFEETNEVLLIQDFGNFGELEFATYGREIC